MKIILVSEPLCQNFICYFRNTLVMIFSGRYSSVGILPNIRVDAMRCVCIFHFFRFVHACAIDSHLTPKTKFLSTNKINKSFGGIVVRDFSTALLINNFLSNGYCLSLPSSRFIQRSKSWKYLLASFLSITHFPFHALALTQKHLCLLYNFPHACCIVSYKYSLIYGLDCFVFLLICF